MRALALIFSLTCIGVIFLGLRGGMRQNNNLDIPSPHLVPLSMGEETLPKLPSYLKENGEVSANLASPLGRGARQRVRGLNVNETLRVVSTSLCGDSYVLSLVGEADIAALSWQSGDALSTAPARYKHKPKARDDVETLLALNPSLVVFGPGEGAAAKPLLDKQGVKYISLIWGEDFQSVQNNLDLLSGAAHKDNVQENVIQYPPREQASVLYLSASGGTAGSGTYVDAAIAAAGGTNIITQEGWYTPSIESLVALNPDLIVTSFFKDGYASVNQVGLRNKVLQDKIKSVPQVNVPGKLWPCAGLGLYAATDIIAKAIEDLN